jgi:predicted MFS family arabinose efflux permease
VPRDFWYLWQGQMVSQVGTQAFQVLALFWMASHTHHASAGALFLTLSLLPPVFLGPYLARWGARFPPRTVMVACDLSASVLALPVLVAIVVDAAVPVVLSMMLISNTLLAVARALMMPTVQATVPGLVDGRSLQSANGWMQTTQQVSSVVGQGVGGLVYALVGPAGLCLANMAGFAMSGAMASRLRSPVVCSTVPPSERPAASWGLLRSNDALRGLSIVSAVFNVLYAPWLVLLPFHLSALKAPGAIAMGLVLASYGAGNLCGNLGLARMQTQPRLLWKAMVGMALALAALGRTGGAGQTAAVLFAMGAGIGFVNVQIMTRVQLSVDAHCRAEAIAVMRSSVNAATPLGYGIVALAQHTLALTSATILTGCGITLLAALLVLQRLVR